MAASQTPTVSVAAIESVEMDMEEEDAMMEAIQGQGTRILNLHGLTWNSQVVQQLARGKKLQTRLKTKCPSSNRSQTTRRTSSWPPSISRIDHYASNWWHFLALSSFFKKKSNFDTWKILENKALMNKNFLDLEWTVVRNGGNRQLSSNIRRFQHSLLL